MKRKFTFVCAMALMAALGEPRAGATAVVAATEPTQVQNNIQLIAQVQAQISNVQQLVSQLRHMREQAQSLADGGGFLQTVSAVHGIHTAVNDFHRSTFEASSMLEEFERTHPGVEIPGNYGQQYDALRNMNRNSVQTALRSIDLQQNEASSTDQVIQQLRNNANNAQSERAALDAGNQLLLAMLEQLRLLNQTQREMLRVMAIATSTADQREGHSDAVIRNRFGRSGQALQPGGEWRSPLEDGSWGR